MQRYAEWLKEKEGHALQEGRKQNLSQEGWKVEPQTDLFIRREREEGPASFGVEKSNWRDKIRKVPGILRKKATAAKNAQVGAVKTLGKWLSKKKYNIDRRHRFLTWGEVASFCTIAGILFTILIGLIAFLIGRDLIKEVTYSTLITTSLVMLGVGAVIIVGLLLYAGRKLDHE